MFVNNRSEIGYLPQAARGAGLGDIRQQIARDVGTVGVVVGEDDDFGIVLRHRIRIDPGIGGEALHEVPVTFIGLQGIWAQRIGLAEIEL